MRRRCNDGQRAEPDDTGCRCNLYHHRINYGAIAIERSGAVLETPSTGNSDPVTTLITYSMLPLNPPATVSATYAVPLLHHARSELRKARLSLRRLHCSCTRCRRSSTQGRSQLRFVTSCYLLFVCEDTERTFDDVTLISCRDAR